MSDRLDVELSGYVFDKLTKALVKAGKHKAFVASEVYLEKVRFTRQKTKPSNAPNTLETYDLLL